MYSVYTRVLIVDAVVVVVVLLVVAVVVYSYNTRNHMIPGTRYLLRSTPPGIHRYLLTIAEYRR